MTIAVEMNSHSKSTSFSRWKPIEIMLAILFSLAPLYYHAHLGGTGLRLPNNISVWFMGCLVIFWLLYKVAVKGIITLPKNIGYFISFPLIVTIVSIANGVLYPMDWLFRIVFLWGGFLFFILLLQDRLSRSRVDRVFFFITMSGLIQAVIGIAQATIPEIILKIGLPISQVNSPFGMFQQINNQGTFLVTTILIGLYILSRPYIVKNSILKRVLLLIFFSISAYVVTLSGSRVSVLTFLIAFPILMYVRRKVILRNKKLFFNAGVFIVIGVCLGADGLSRLADKTNRITSGYSQNARLEIYKISSDLIQQSPFTGHGIGSFISVYHKQKIHFNDEYNGVGNAFSELVTHPHNELLFWAIETGIPSVLGLLLILVGIALSVRQQLYRLTFLILMIPIMFHTQLELPFYTSSLHWFCALFILTVLVNTASRKEVNIDLSRTMQRFLLAMTILFSSIFLTFFIHTALSSYELGKKDSSVFLLKYADKNPYFSQLVESVRLKTLFLEANHNKSKQGMREFVEWGGRYIEKEPSDQMYLFMAMAYNNLGMIQKMCVYTEEGVSIYPDFTPLNQLYGQCK